MMSLGHDWLSTCETFGGDSEDFATPSNFPTLLRLSAMVMSHRVSIFFLAFALVFLFDETAQAYWRRRRSPIPPESVRAVASSIKWGVRNFGAPKIF